MRHRQQSDAAGYSFVSTTAPCYSATGVPALISAVETNPCSFPAVRDTPGGAYSICYIRRSCTSYVRRTARAVLHALPAVHALLRVGTCARAGAVALLASL